MAASTLTDSQIKGMKFLGWDFVPTGTEEWTWIKFDGANNKMIAQGGDGAWTADLASL